MEKSNRRGKISLWLALTIFALSTAQSWCETCDGIFDRSLVITLTKIEASPRGGHLAEFENLALKMAQQADELLPAKNKLKEKLDPYIGKLREKNTLIHEAYLMFVPLRVKYPVDKIVNTLIEVEKGNVAKELRSAVRNKRLTLARLFDLSLIWALAMTTAEFVESGNPFELNERESFYLWEFLEGQRETFLALEPMAYFRFHQTPMAIESIVATSPKPILPIQVIPRTVKHSFEKLNMSPIETIIHDIYHAVQRMKQDLGWLFPGGSAFPYFVSGLSWKPGQKAFEPLILTPEFITGAKSKQRERELFHRSIFTRYRNYPENVQASIELIWFSLYFADKISPVIERPSMDRDGLNLLLKEMNEWKLSEIAQAAQSGGLGARYRRVDQSSLAAGVRTLQELIN